MGDGVRSSRRNVPRGTGTLAPVTENRRLGSSVCPALLMQNLWLRSPSCWSWDPAKDRHRVSIDLCCCQQVAWSGSSAARCKEAQRWAEFRAEGNLRVRAGDSRARGLAHATPHLPLKWAPFWHKNRHSDQGNKIKNPEMDPQTYSRLIFDKPGKNIQWNKDSLFSK